VAAQLLAGQGFKEVYNLKGGIQAWHGLKAAGPAEVGMARISGEETWEEILTLAFGMEEGLRVFYLEMAEREGAGDVSELFRQMALLEEHHKEWLSEIFRDLKGGGAENESLERVVDSDEMEGGLSMEEFLAANEPALKSTRDVVSMAMVLETQALDLYLRYAHTMKREKAREIINGLADQEKIHLSNLARLLDKHTDDLMRV
jgi:rubrerythrin